MPSPLDPAIPSSGHEPVMLDQVLTALDPRPRQVVLDCTLGRGGHALEIARRLGPEGLLVGIDVDPQNLEFAASRLREAAGSCHFRFFHASFAELPEVIQAAGMEGRCFHGILADLGLSTNQLFDPRYGLSFAQDMPLDMRIDPRLPQSAADLVNRLGEPELANVLYELAQERYSRQIARKITEARRVSPISSTKQLAELVRWVYAARGGLGREKIDPATRTFLALRMAVNREMENLAGLLEQAPRLLVPGGRLAVISFQSMEDRLVKQAFRSAEQSGLLGILGRKPQTPAPEEIAANPRSRSAKLRVAEKIGPQVAAGPSL